MFDVGWTELVVIACVAILVVGPKDLPRMLRAFGKTMAGVRRVAGDFRKQFDEAMRESELADIARDASSIKTFQPLEEARKTMAEAQKALRDGIEGSAAGIEAAAGKIGGEPQAAALEGPPAKTPAPDTAAGASAAAGPPEVTPPAAKTAAKSARKSTTNGHAGAKDGAS